MVSVIVLARLLTPVDFGLVAMVTSLYMILGDIGILGLSDATVQREKINHDQISTLFWINVSVCLLLTLVLIALAPLIAWFYDEPRLKMVSVFIATIFILTGVSTQHLALLKRNMKFKSIAVNEIAAATISGILAIIIAWLGGGYWSIVARRISLTGVTAIGVWILCGWRPGLPLIGSGIRPMIKYGINALGGGTIYNFSKSLDRILIGWMHGGKSLGYYDRANHLFVLPLNLLTFPLSSVVLPALSRLQNDHARYRQFYLKALSNIALIGMPVGVILSLNAIDLVKLLLGQKWIEAAKFLSIFGVGLGVALTYYTCGWLHLSIGRAERYFRWNVVAFIITALLFFIGLPFGALGVAIAYTVSFYILIGPGLWYAGRPININLSAIFSVIWKQYFSSLGAGIATWILLYSFNESSVYFYNLNIFFRIFTSSIVCGVFYVLLTIIIYRSTEPISQFISLIVEAIQNFNPKSLRYSNVK
ncbi:MAG: oligosaccharide flippase family protein [Candidatus Dadabacteria bacterium]|nr:oligosaccharide flippase family protein [Candidatus Dadabacteria bacterium]